jgi:phosphotransferase system  glucose/maltose/N-acetylglucosamine-specific IIC component
VTIAPILVLLAAGIIIGLLMLMTEQFVHVKYSGLAQLELSDDHTIKNTD